MDNENVVHAVIREIDVDKIIEEVDVNDENRLLLQEILENLMESRNVYFQPPSSMHINTPGIVYNRNRIIDEHANNKVYTQKNSYNVTVIDPNPDSVYVRRISRLPLCTHNRHYTENNLNYDSFTLYF